MSSWFHPHTEKRSSPVQGRGLFARAAIARGELIAVKGGRIYERDEFEAVRERLGPAEIQIEDELFIAPFDVDDREANLLCLNHSCEPNVGVRGQNSFVALRDISPEEELLIDYAMIDGDPDERMDCNCGSQHCRGSISGDDWRLPALQKRYAGHFSAYLRARIDAQGGPR